jgi:hypothetical protein
LNAFSRNFGFARLDVVRGFMVFLTVLGFRGDTGFFFGALRMLSAGFILNLLARLGVEILLGLSGVRARRLIVTGSGFDEVAEKIFSILISRLKRSPWIISAITDDISNRFIAGSLFRLAGKFD